MRVVCGFLDVGTLSTRSFTPKRRAETLQRGGVQIVWEATDVFDRLFERDHICVLHRHVEEIDLVRRLAAVEDAFFDNRNLEVVRERIDDTGADAAASRGAR